MPVTMVELAQRAGVSIATISLVISDNPRISPATKERVRKIMEEMNYVPNVIARGLANNSLKTVGVVMSLGPRQALRHPYIFEMLAGMEGGLRDGGYQLLLHHWDVWNQSPKELVNLWEQKRVDGFILQLTDPLKPHLPDWTARGLPYILIGNPQDVPEADWVDADNQEAGALAWTSVRNAGFQNPGFVGVQGDGIHGARYQGFLKASGGKSSPVTWVPQGGEGEVRPGDIQGKPDCLVCGSHYLALSLAHGPWGLLTFDDLPFMDYMAPPLSTVDIDVYHLGYQAAEGLVMKLKNPALRIQKTLSLSRFIPRQSTVLYR